MLSGQTPCSQPNHQRPGSLAANVRAGPNPWRTVRRSRSVPLKRTMPPRNAFIGALSAQARRTRLLGQVAHPDDNLIEGLTEPDQSRDIAFAAVLWREEDAFIGVGRYSTDVYGAECEVAVTAPDQWQIRRPGTALMRHIIDVARNRGRARPWSMDLESTVRRRKLAADLGLKRSPDPDNASQVIHSLELFPKSDGERHEAGWHAASSAPCPSLTTPCRQCTIGDRPAVSRRRPPAAGTCTGCSTTTPLQSGQPAHDSDGFNAAGNLHADG